MTKGSVRALSGPVVSALLLAGCLRADPEYRKTVAVVDRHSRIQSKEEGDRAAPAAIKELGGPALAAEKLIRVLLTSRGSADRMGGATGLLIHCGKPGKKGGDGK